MSRIPGKPYDLSRKQKRARNGEPPIEKHCISLFEWANQYLNGLMHKIKTISASPVFRGHGALSRA